VTAFDWVWAFNCICIHKHIASLQPYAGGSAGENVIACL